MATGVVIVMGMAMVMEMVMMIAMASVMMMILMDKGDGLCTCNSLHSPAPPTIKACHIRPVLNEDSK